MKSQNKNELETLIANRIAQTQHQRITFAEYMDLVLYHPQLGYYASSTNNIGAQGDFITSPHLGADFGELLAEQFVEMWKILNRPTPFTLVEMGAGQGLVAADVLSYLHKQYPDFFEVIEYLIVEKAAGMISQQQQVLQRLLPNVKNQHGKLPLRWSSFEEIPEESIIGCCFSNELVDALPVHQIVLNKGQLQEIYVTTDNEQDFIEVVGELSTPQLAEYFNLVGVQLSADVYPDGYRSEVNLAALDWMSTVAQRLKRGYLLTIDYGYPAVRYYNPIRHQGTLQCYYRHRHHDNPYLYIGQQDITAHVDFTALECQGELCGLQQLGFTKQGLFFMALGLGNRIANLSTTSEGKNQGIQAVLQRREALHKMIDPMGLGGFGVLVQSKGLLAEESAQSLKSLRLPAM